jgi:hypothetical protein
MKQKRMYQTPTTDACLMTNESVMAASVEDLQPGRRYDAGDDLAAPTGGSMPLGGGIGAGSLLKMTRTLLPLLCLGLATASCSNEDPGGEAPTPAPEPTEKLVTLTVTASSGTDATTRTLYTDNYDRADEAKDGIEVTWNNGEETIGAVYYTGTTPDGYDNDKSVNYSFSGDGSGTKSMSFIGTIPASTGTLADKYSFYYPIRNMFGAWSTPSPYDFSNQMQNGDGSTAHLKDFDVMYTPRAVTATTGGTSDPFTFVHAAALLRFDFTLPEDATITSVRIRNSDKPFYSMLRLTFNDDAEGSITPSGYSVTNTLTLAIEGDTYDNKLRAYMMIPPTDLIIGKTLNIFASTDSKVYTTTATIPSDAEGFVAGKTYTFVRTAANNDFTE